MSYEYLIDPISYSKNIYTKEDVFRFNRDYQERGETTQSFEQEFDDHLSEREEFKYSRNFFKKGNK